MGEEDGWEGENGYRRKGEGKEGIEGKESSEKKEGRAGGKKEGKKMG